THTRLPVIGGGVVLLLLAGALATVFGRRLAGAIRQLSASARSLGREQDFSRTGGSGIAELDAAEREIAEAVSERLKAEEALRERKRAEGSLAESTDCVTILFVIDRLLIAEEAPVAIAEAAVRRLRCLLGVARGIVNVFDVAAG